jgi:hypothetical protein
MYIVIFLILSKFHAKNLGEEKVCAMTKWRTKGVNARLLPGNDHEELYTDELGEDVFTATERIEIFLVHDADPRWENIEKVIELGKDIAEIYEKFKS